MYGLYRMNFGVNILFSGNMNNLLDLLILTFMYMNSSYTVQLVFSKYIEKKTGIRIFDGINVTVDEKLQMIL